MQFILSILITITILFLFTYKHNQYEPFYSSYRRVDLPSKYYYPYKYKFGFYLYPKYMKDYDLWRYRYNY